MAVGARTFATANHAPPLRVHGIPGRYAGAIYTAASKAGAKDKVENEVCFILFLYKFPFSPL